MNEVAIKDFSVEYQPTKIIINNQDQLKSAVESYANKFKGLVVTEETLADSKHARAELNKLKRSLDSRRKEIKKDYNKPLKEFEATIKSYETEIDDVNSDIDKGIKELESRQREEKRNHINKIINEMAPNYGISADEIEIEPSWLNKISNKKLVEAIAGTMKAMVDEKRKRETEEKLVRTECQAKGLDPSGWLYMLGTYNALDICKQIDDEAEQIEQRKQAEKAAKQAKLEAAKANLKKIGNKNIDKSTGEVVVEKQTVTFTLKGTKEQLDLIAKLIVKNDVEVIKATERETVLEG
ncbi:MAG: DUF1351 domain-containing protein [Liquorilactobacillus ghanensis]|uniref:DUF1351 domain-containing protein n=1 Tax=Liquorilactobacillus ghanensis TaxID=399370 RepID=UPI0039EAC89E